MTNTNLNPLAIELPAELETAFTDMTGKVEELALSTHALRIAAEAAGIRLAHFTRPTKESTPEHRFSYATLHRLAIGKLAALQGVSVDAFGPLYNDAVKAAQTLEIGQQSKTKKAWQSVVSNVLRPVKDNWEREIKAELEAAKLVSKMQEADVAKATTLDARANEQLEKADVIAQVLRDKAAELAEKAATAKGKAKIKLEAQHAAALAKVEEAEAATAAYDAEATRTALELIARQEVLEELQDEVEAIAVNLPKKRGTKKRETPVSAALVTLNALITTVQKMDGDDAGTADLSDTLMHLMDARTALSK